MGGFEVWDFMIDHWPKGVFAAVVSMLTWFGRREVKRNDDWHKKHEERLEVLESKPQGVTIDVIDELRSSMNASMINLSERIERGMDRMHDQNTQTLDRIHQRVDDLWKSHHAGGGR